MADGELELPEEIVAPQPAAPIEGRWAPTPYSFEFTGEDRLRVTAWNSLSGVVVAVHFRVSRRGAPTHASTFRMTPTTDRLATTQDFTIGEGYLLNVSAFASSGAPVVGQTFVSVKVIRGSGAAVTVLGTIVQGYITARQDLGWPGSPIQGSLETGGYLRLFEGTTPVAGAECFQPVPAGARWELVSVQLQLATGANVIDRHVRLQINNSADSQWLTMDSRVVQPTSLSYNYYYQTAFGSDVAFGPAIQSMGMAGSLLLPAGAIVRSSTSNLQGNDQFAAPRIVLREWLEAL